jgi:hypothetical protein
MMCTPYMSRELCVFKIIIIYIFFIEFIDNKKLDECDRHDVYTMHYSYASFLTNRTRDENAEEHSRIMPWLSISSHYCSISSFSSYG